MKIIVSNTSLFSVDRDFVKKIIRKILLTEGNKDAKVSVVFINKKEMVGINRKYRKKNRATDVLSFPQNSFGLKGTDINFLGEILICPAVIKEANNLAGVPYNKDLSRIIIHGMLHLLGYDHKVSKKEEKIMTEKEEFYLSLCS